MNMIVWGDGNITAGTPTELVAQLIVGYEGLTEAGRAEARGSVLARLVEVAEEDGRSAPVDSSSDVAFLESLVALGVARSFSS